MRRTGPYLWERREWPVFSWDSAALLGRLATARFSQGELQGVMSHATPGQRRLAEIDARTDEALGTCAIDGATLSRAGVRQSIARRPGMQEAASPPQDAQTEGVVEVTLDATLNSGEPLTIERLDRWHAALVPAPSESKSVTAVGRWRHDARGPVEAPPATRIGAEMASFLRWFESPATEDGLLRSGLAHLWFVTIRPFDAGNGRIARAIAEMALARDGGGTPPLVSLSRQMHARKNAYFAALERAQRGTLDITAWLRWYLDTYASAAETAQEAARDFFRAAAFWNAHADTAFSNRQRRILDRILQDFQGTLTTKQWAEMAPTSPDSAQRDIADLVAKGVLVKNEGGSKNTSYSIKESSSRVRRG